MAPLLDEAAAAPIWPRPIPPSSTPSATPRRTQGRELRRFAHQACGETLTQEFPKQFATLSPIPGLRSWLSKNGDAALAELDEAKGGPGKSAGGVSAAQLLAALDDRWRCRKSRWCVRPPCFAPRAIWVETAKGRPLDAVARFHLGNGARVERLNWAQTCRPRGSSNPWG
jgi:malonyl-CoA decarboxylase